MICRGGRGRGGEGFRDGEEGEGDGKIGRERFEGLRS